MIKLNQWESPEPELSPPDEPELYCYRCGKTIESGEKYFCIRRLYSGYDRVLCMDCVDYFTEEA